MEAILNFFDYYVIITHYLVKSYQKILISTYYLMRNIYADKNTLIFK